jgi:hypothetical protein
MTKNPWKEAFLSSNFKLVLIATIVVLGQGVVWYSGLFWALYFLQQVSKLDALTATRSSSRLRRSASSSAITAASLSGSVGARLMFDYLWLL